MEHADNNQENSTGERRCTGSLVQRLVIFIVACIILTGCEVGFDSGQPDPGTFKCNEKQMSLVELETRVCSETSFFSEYCFAIAKATICDKIVAENAGR